MSLILDAINKSEREQDNTGEIPHLKTDHGASVNSVIANPRLMWLFIGTAGLLLVALAVLIWVLLSGTASQRPDPAPNVTTTEPVLQSPPAREEMMPTSTAHSTAADASLQTKLSMPADDEVASLYQDASEIQEEVIAQPPTVQPAKVVQPSSAASVDEALARTLWEEAKRQMPSRPVASNRTPSQPEQESETEAPYEDTLEAYSGTPFLHELPVSVQNTIPTMMYALHRYEEGFAVINKKRFQQGDDIAGGMVIERFLADGLILNLDGHQFKLSALNSWVNY